VVFPRAKRTHQCVTLKQITDELSSLISQLSSM
jgi:hypothetical protein